MPHSQDVVVLNVLSSPKFTKQRYKNCAFRRAYCIRSVPAEAGLLLSPGNHSCNSSSVVVVVCVCGVYVNM